jgi:hypothetical protein
MWVNLTRIANLMGQVWVDPFFHGSKNHLFMLVFILHARSRKVMDLDSILPSIYILRGVKDLELKKIFVMTILYMV